MNNRQIKRPLTPAFIVLAMMLALPLFFACNPTKRAYKQIEKLPPITNNDSARLNKRSLQTWPVIIGEVKPGKPVIDTASLDTIAYYKGLLDSVLLLTPKVVEELKEIYKDTCITAIDQYGKGFNLGYRAGEYFGRSSCPPSTTVHDTLMQTPHPVEVELGGLRLENSRLNTLNIQTSTELALKKKQAKTRLYWIIGESLLLLLIIGYSAYKLFTGGIPGILGKVVAGK